MYLSLAHLHILISLRGRAPGMVTLIDSQSDALTLWLNLQYLTVGWIAMKYIRTFMAPKGGVFLIMLILHLSIQSDQSL